VIAHSGELSARGSLLRRATELRRGEYFAWLLALGCISGLASRIIQSTVRDGWTDALFNTFDVSAIVWLSCAAGIALVLGDRTVGIRSLDLAVGAAFLCLVILPIGPLSWVAISALSLHLIVIGPNVDTSRRGAFILLAVTVPMLWSRLLFQLFANLILEMDGSLVGWILGTHRAGAVIDFADGSGVLVILPACSSLANMSLAVLCWVTVSQMAGHKASAYDLLWCLLACMAVIAANVTRLSLMGLSQSHYVALHGPWAEAAGNAIILALIVGISVLGVRRELFQRV
jgi:hypothetical protein